jgi:hypothetical protein
MNETSNISSSTTGGVCSSCLKEMPIVMTSSSSSRLCSNCITEFIDPQQQFSSDMNNKFPLFPSSQSLLSLQQQQQQQQQSQSMIQSHFSPLSSSSASSTSSSISSTNRRFSTFDPFTSGNDLKTNFLHPLTDLNNAFSPLTSSNLNHNNNDFESTATTTDFMRYFHHFLNGNNQNNIGDRDSPSSSIQSNDFSPLLASSLPNNNHHSLSQSLLQRQHSAFSSLDSTTSSTPSLNRLSTNDLPSSFCCFANNPPYTYCLECETSLCEKCALTHPKMLGFKDHRQQLLSSSQFHNNNNSRSIIGQPPRQQQQPQPPPSADILPAGTGKVLFLWFLSLLQTFL